MRYAQNFRNHFQFNMETMVRTAIALLSIMFVTGCGKSTPPPIDPVAGLKAVMDQLQANLNSQKPVLTPPTPGESDQWWSRQIYTTPTVEFDVQKTESLVSPYRGIVVFECNARFAKGQAKEDVQGDLREFTTNKCRATYAFQDKKWVFKALACNRNPMTPTVFPEIEPGDSSIQGQCRDIASATSP